MRCGLRMRRERCGKRHRDDRPRRRPRPRIESEVRASWMDCFLLGAYWCKLCSLLPCAHSNAREIVLWWSQQHGRGNLIRIPLGVNSRVWLSQLIKKSHQIPLRTWQRACQSCSEIWSGRLKDVGYILCRPRVGDGRVACQSKKREWRRAIERRAFIFYVASRFDTTTTCA